MADHIVMPPVQGCPCSFCVKRKWELQLAARIERELHDAIMADLEGKRRTYLLEREAGWKLRHRYGLDRPAVQREPWKRRREA